MRSIWDENGASGEKVCRVKKVYTKLAYVCIVMCKSVKSEVYQTYARPNGRWYGAGRGRAGRDATGEKVVGKHKLF